MKKGRGNGVVRALGETRDEFDAFWIDGPTGTNSDDDEAHPGGKIPILLTARARGDSQVSRKARAIRVISSDVCWASSVKGLDVNQEVGACPVIITEDDVGGMANPSANALHPLVNRTLATEASTLGGDSRGTNDCIEERDKSLDGGIVSGRMKSEAVGACHKVPVARADEDVAIGLIDRGTGRASRDPAIPLDRRREKEVEGKGNRKVIGILEGEERSLVSVRGGDRKASKPGEGPSGVAAVEQTGSAGGSGALVVKEGEESM